MFSRIIRIREDPRRSGLRSITSLGLENMTARFSTGANRKNMTARFSTGANRKNMTAVTSRGAGPSVR